MIIALYAVLLDSLVRCFSHTVRCLASPAHCRASCTFNLQSHFSSLSNLFFSLANFFCPPLGTGILPLLHAVQPDPYCLADPDPEDQINADMWRSGSGALFFSAIFNSSLFWSPKFYIYIFISARRPRDFYNFFFLLKNYTVHQYYRAAGH
jgi:hypothetical protein